MADNGKIIRNGAEIQIDENGNVVARPADGQEFIVEDDARVGTLEAGELTRNETVINENSTWDTIPSDILSDPDDVSSTDFTSVAPLGGVVSFDAYPNGLTLYGRLRVSGGIEDKSDPSDELRVRIIANKPQEIGQAIPELTVSTTESGKDNIMDSGFVEITSISSGVWNIPSLRAEVDSGTGVFGEQDEHYCLFEWRVD